MCFQSDRELVRAYLPIMCGVAPIGSNVPQYQPDAFRRGHICREVARRFDNFAQLKVDVLDGVREVEGVT
jgi:hypothetical protein